MSKTYELGCYNCKEYIWVAQGWGVDDGYFYGTDDFRKKMYKFLHEHMGHNLKFSQDNDDFADLDDNDKEIWKEIKWD